MIESLDFTQALLSAGPYLVRDGGSILIHVEVGGQSFAVRFAGGFADVLSGQEGKLEFQYETTENQKSVFVDASTLTGWEMFVSQNASSLGGYEEKFLGGFQTSNDGKAAILDAFTRSS